MTKQLALIEEFLSCHDMMTIFSLFFFCTICVKSVSIRSFPGPYFPAFGLNTICPYSVRMLENTDQKNSEYGHFLRSVGVEDLPHKFLLENYLVSVEFHENRTGKITVWVYFVSVNEIMSVAVNRLGVEFSSLFTTTF